jgi:hypothetical protein
MATEADLRFWIRACQSAIINYPYAYTPTKYFDMQLHIDMYYILSPIVT